MVKYKEFSDDTKWDYPNDTYVTYNVMSKVNAFDEKHTNAHIVDVTDVGCHYTTDGTIVPTHYRLVTVAYTVTM